MPPPRVYENQGAQGGFSKLFSAGRELLFYVKCRPQGADAWRIAEEYKIVFVGYPPWKHAPPDPNMRSGYQEALWDVSAEPACASRLAYKRGYRSQVSQNANLVAAVTRAQNAFVIVPRPEAGVCQVARIAGNFSVADAPPWAERYLELRRNQRLADSPAATHLGDVVQHWPVVEWRPITFPLVPRWISYRLLSRNTAGVIYGIPELKLNPHERLQALLSERKDGPGGKSETAALLVEWVSPSAFEHLIVHLLQLEAVNPNSSW